MGISFCPRCKVTVRNGEENINFTHAYERQNVDTLKQAAWRGFVVAFAKTPYNLQTFFIDTFVVQRSPFHDLLSPYFVFCSTPVDTSF